MNLTRRTSIMKTSQNQNQNQYHYSSGNHRRGVGRAANRTTPLSPMQRRTAAIHACQSWSVCWGQAPTTCDMCEWAALCPVQCAEIREVVLSPTESLFFHAGDAVRRQMLVARYPSVADQISKVTP